MADAPQMMDMMSTSPKVHIGAWYASAWKVTENVEPFSELQYGTVVGWGRHPDSTQEGAYTMFPVENGYDLVFINRGRFTDDMWQTVTGGHAHIIVEGLDP